MNSPKRSFLYFAYGSNLLEKRIRIQNPSALRKNIGYIKDHKLDFFGFSQRWGGASATIVPTYGHDVWGAVWEIDIENLQDLDNQEGVPDKIYFPRIVDVELHDGETLQCRVYQRFVDPSVIEENHGIFPSGKPSLLYKETILQGALESNLPESYLKMLRNIADNGYCGQAEMGHLLNVI